ncbi:MAG: hypothetical protein EOO68_10155 [Moraxellaceae bacterium]|nr:MAG: hypothetical protein EOO68_10155 [Moraxellaceae bacterium]
MEYIPESSSPEQRMEFLKWLTEQTVADLNKSTANPSAIQSAINVFLERAKAARLSMEEIENLLGISEPSIMDLAQLSDADEELVIDAFELFSNN